MSSPTPRRIAALGTAVLLGSLLVPAGPATALEPTPGAPGIGDHYFPKYGNGGYDVSHYDLSLRYGMKSERLVGDATLTATATQDLSQFNLDLQLRAQRVWVDGHRATFTQGKRELVVVPATPVTDEQEFRVRVTYDGEPATVASRGLGGWWKTSDGAVAAGEPEVATLWFPSNDHPADKATYDITTNVTAGKQVISNGELIDRSRSGERVSWHWRVRQPMATYLATVVIGDYRIERGRTPGGVRYLYGISRHMKPALERAATRSLYQTPKVVDFFTQRLGFYPFDSAGGTLVNASFGFSLENQTRPNYSKVFFQGGKDIDVIAHELAHQWWGDTVSVHRWRDIFMNEGFATWSSWWYQATRPSADFTLNDIFAETYDTMTDWDEFWEVPISDPGASRLFDFAVYYRGAMAVQALRNRIGASTHTELLRQWAAAHRDGNGSLADFEALAETVSGQDLDTFFAEWLDQPDRPMPSAELGFPGSMLRGRAPHPVPDHLIPSPPHRDIQRTSS